MNRRSFLGACLALGVAPAIVRADSLMRVVPRGMATVAADFSLIPSTTYWVVRSGCVMEVLAFDTPHSENFRRRVIPLVRFHEGPAPVILQAMPGDEFGRRFMSPAYSSGGY